MDLPAWYSKKKYNGLAECDGAHWYELILQRATFRHYFSSDGYQGSRFSKELNAPKVRMRENPLSRLQTDMEELLFGGGQLSILKSDPRKYSTMADAIAPLTFRNVYQIENHLNEDARNQLRQWFAAVFDASLEKSVIERIRAHSKWALSFIDDPISDILERADVGSTDYDPMDPRSVEFVSIDLSVSDKILVERFKEYLGTIRHKYPNLVEQRGYKYPEYKKWIEFSVLPYLDLTIWAIEEQVSIPNRVMADAIFADGTKGEEAIRKTTSKLADRILSASYIKFLGTIIAAEKAEYNAR